MKSVLIIITALLITNSVVAFNNPVSLLVHKVTDKITKIRARRKKNVKNYIKDILNGTTINHSLDVGNPHNKKIIQTVGVTTGGVLCIGSGLYIISHALMNPNTSAVAELLKCSLGIVLTCSGFYCITHSDTLLDQQSQSA